MEFTQISNIFPKVSRIGLGTWAIGGWLWGGTNEKESIEAILRGLDKGINLIDTAPVYGFGLSEEIVGKAIKQHGKREKIIIATKCGLNWKEDKIFRDSSRERIREEIETSLKRLQVDWIDLYQIHWPDHLIPFSETAEEMNKLLKEGKIRAIGVSNYSIDEMNNFQKTAPIHSLQSPFNLFERAIERKELPYTQQKKIATLGYGPLCRGLLTGKMNADSTFSSDDLRSVDPKFKKPAFQNYLDAVKKLNDWCQKKHRKSVLSLALRWVLDKQVSIALWGVRKPEQLGTLESVWNWKLEAADMKEIDEILRKTVPNPLGPEFMAPSDRKEKAHVSS